MKLKIKYCAPPNQTNDREKGFRIEASDSKYLFIPENSESTFPSCEIDLEKLIEWINRKDEWM